MRAKPLYEFHLCLSTPPPPPPPPIRGQKILFIRRAKVFQEPGGKSWSDRWLIGIESVFRDYLIYMFIYISLR